LAWFRADLRPGQFGSTFERLESWAMVSLVGFLIVASAVASFSANSCL